MKCAKSQTSKLSFITTTTWEWLCLVFIISLPSGFVSGQVFNWKAANQISSPESGLGGVFIVADSDGNKIVAKFVNEQPVNAIFAERVLELVGVATPATEAHKAGSSEFKRIAGILKDLIAKPNATDRTKDVYAKTVPSATSVLIQGYVVGAAGAESAAHALTCFRDQHGQSLPAMSTTAMNDDKTMQSRLDQLNAILGLLSNAEQQKTIGRLNVVDALLGNEDRTLKSEINFGNLMMQESPRRWVAIDNFSAFPSPESLGWHLGAGEISLTEEFTRTKPGPKTKSKYKHANALTRQLWYDQLIKGFWYWRGNDALLLANTQLAMDFDAEAKRLSQALQKHLKRTCDDVALVNLALLPDSINSKPKNEWRANPSTTTVWTITIVNTISDSQNRPEGTHLSTSEFIFDWREVEQNLIAGMNEARLAILTASRQQRSSPISELKNSTLGKILKGFSGEDKNHELSMDALLIKVKFLDEYPTTGDYDAIRSKNLSQPDKVINVSGPWYLQAEPSGATTNRLILRK